MNIKYNIIIEPDAEEVKARNFIQKLQKAINSLSFMPQRCRNSYYIEDGKTKDLIYQGYTICYHILNHNVHIVALFRQR